jgi:hypothetical protein
MGVEVPEHLASGLFVFRAVLILISLLGRRFKNFNVAVSFNACSLLYKSIQIN